MVMARVRVSRSGSFNLAPLRNRRGRGRGSWSQTGR